MHLFNVGPYCVALLPETAAPDIQSLFERCEDYFQLVEGRPPATDAAILEWRDRPPGCGPGDVFCLALRDTNGLAGVIFALRNFPTFGDWYLGLSLLHPARRGAGLGAAFYQGFEAWVARQGGRRILLAVVEPNQRAARFWERLGFTLPRAYPARPMGLQRHVIIEYEKTLDSPPEHAM
jgi:GNAT superfamily N-acetyltransferase